jgi:hypothetical protein
MFVCKVLDLKAYEKIKVHIGVKYLCRVRAAAWSPCCRSNDEASALRVLSFSVCRLRGKKNEQRVFFSTRQLGHFLQNRATEKTVSEM